MMMTMVMMQVMQNLTSWSFADDIRKRVDANRTHNIKYYRPAHSARPLDSGTTHLSVHSPDGAAVAVTSTVNTVYVWHCVTCSGLLRCPHNDIVVA